ncbi:MAG: hypothetical protein WBE68_06740, partial [Candidatus Nitrosopolaris sp.]
MSSNIDDRVKNKNPATGTSNTNTDNPKASTKVTNLRVAEVAEQRDVGRKIGRIDPYVAELLNISSGDA